MPVNVLTRSFASGSNYSSRQHGAAPRDLLVAAELPVFRFSFTLWLFSKVAVDRVYFCNRKQAAKSC